MLTNSIPQHLFDRINLGTLALEPSVAHSGEGTIRFHRILTSEEIAGSCNFMDFSIVPPGCSIGEHTHSSAEEEFYLILRGEGVMIREGAEFRVQAGDLIRNPPGGRHSLRNDSSYDLHMFVFELRVR